MAFIEDGEKKQLLLGGSNLGPFGNIVVWREVFRLGEFEPKSRERTADK